MGNDAAGVSHATSSSLTDQLTRQHRMTLDEAQLILNVKRGDEMQQVLKVTHLFLSAIPALSIDFPTRTMNIFLKPMLPSQN